MTTADTSRSHEAGELEEYNRQAETYKSPYELWKEAEGIPTVRGLAVQNVFEVELTPWKSRGGKGLFINLDGTGGFNDMYVYELGPGESSTPIRHIFEETTFILTGQGGMTVWNNPAKKQTLEFKANSYFAIPPNAWRQYHNGSGTEAMRFIAMTAAPRVIDTFKSLDFVFNNPYQFADRFNDEAGYFSETEHEVGRRGWWNTNFIADVFAATPTPGAVFSEGRGGGTVSTVFAMVNSTVRSHSQAWPVGTHSKFHRHGPGIHVVMLRGKGYSRMGLDYEHQERVDWQPGSVFVPPEGWWHAHYNTGKDPALFLAIGWGSDKPKAGGRSYVYKTVKEGGDQYEFEDDDQAVHAEFEAELAKNGVKDQMGSIHPHCTHK